MSLPERQRLSLGVALALVAFAPAYGQQKAAVVCPPSIAVTESAAPIPGWNISTGKVEHAFERISIFNGKPGEREFDLAPDDQKQAGNRIAQTWTLKAYRTMNIFLRCRYHDTAVVLSMDLPPNIEDCKLRFTADARGRITGKSDMECR
jgi:hypothetical protein